MAHLVSHRGPRTRIIDIEMDDLWGTRRRSPTAMEKNAFQGSRPRFHYFPYGSRSPAAERIPVGFLSFLGRKLPPPATETPPAERAIFKLCNVFLHVENSLGFPLFSKSESRTLFSSRTAHKHLNRKSRIRRVSRLKHYSTTSLDLKSRNRKEIIKVKGNPTEYVKGFKYLRFLYYWNSHVSFRQGTVLVLHRTVKVRSQKWN